MINSPPQRNFLMVNIWLQIVNFMGRAEKLLNCWTGVNCYRDRPESVTCGCPYLLDLDVFIIKLLLFLYLWLRNLLLPDVYISAHGSIVAIFRWFYVGDVFNFGGVWESGCEGSAELELPELILRDLKLLQIRKLNRNTFITRKIPQLHHHYIGIFLIDLRIPHKMPLLNTFLVFFLSFVFLLHYSIDNFVPKVGLEFVKYTKIVNREIV